MPHPLPFFQSTPNYHLTYKQRSFKITCENLEEVTEASDAEGGLSKSSKYIPVDYDIVARYDKISTLYELPLSPSVISLTEEKETGKVSEAFWKNIQFHRNFSMFCLLEMIVFGAKFPPTLIFLPILVLAKRISLN